jgi:hypothetical protein
VWILPPKKTLQQSILSIEAHRGYAHPFLAPIQATYLL